MIVSILPFLASLGLFLALLFSLEKGLHELHFGTRGWSRRLFLGLTVVFSAANWRFFFLENSRAAILVLVIFSASIWLAFRLFEKEKNVAGFGLFLAAWLAFFVFFFEPNLTFEKMKKAAFWPVSLGFWPVLPVFFYFLKKTDLAPAAKKTALGGAFFGSLGAVFLSEKGTAAAVLASYFLALVAVFPVWDRALMLGLEFLKKWQVWAVVGALFLIQIAGFFF